MAQLQPHERAVTVRIETVYGDGTKVVEHALRHEFEVPVNWKPVHVLGIWGEYVWSDFESVNTATILVTREDVR